MFFGMFVLFFQRTVYAQAASTPKAAPPNAPVANVNLPKAFQAAPTNAAVANSNLPKAFQMTAKTKTPQPPGLPPPWYTEQPLTPPPSSAEKDQEAVAGDYEYDDPTSWSNWDSGSTYQQAAQIVFGTVLLLCFLLNVNFNVI